VVSAEAFGVQAGKEAFEGLLRAQCVFPEVVREIERRVFDPVRVIESEGDGVQASAQHWQSAQPERYVSVKRLERERPSESARVEDADAPGVTLEPVAVQGEEDRVETRQLLHAPSLVVRMIV
jgi:hypothetical protein